MEVLGHQPCHWDAVAFIDPVGDDQFRYPRAAVWVPSQSNWLITTEVGGNRVKVTNVRTGAMICQLGQRGGGLLEPRL